VTRAIKRLLVVLLFLATATALLYWGSDWNKRKRGRTVRNLSDLQEFSQRWALQPTVTIDRHSEVNTNVTYLPHTHQTKENFTRYIGRSEVYGWKFDGSGNLASYFRMAETKIAGFRFIDDEGWERNERGELVRFR
jgi:hypothetical protein